MKKLLILCVMLVALGCIGCGKDNNSNNYEEDCKNVVNTIDEMNKKSIVMGDTLTMIWNKSGPDHVMDILADLSNFDCSKDYIYRSAGYVEYVKSKFELSDEETIQLCKNYQDALKGINEIREKAKEEIHKLKEDYGDKDISALKEYYAESDSFLDFVLKPSGNYQNYSAQYEETKNNLTKLKKEAELDSL